MASDPPLRVSASGSDSVHVGVGAPGGLTIDSRGSPLAQPPLVHRDHSPFRLGPVKTPIAQGPVVPMGLATKRANLMASECYFYHSVYKGILHERAVCV